MLNWFIRKKRQAQSILILEKLRREAQNQVDRLSIFLDDGYYSDKNMEPEEIEFSKNYAQKRINFVLENYAKSESEFLELMR